MPITSHGPELGLYTAEYDPSHLQYGMPAGPQLKLAIEEYYPYWQKIDPKMQLRNRLANEARFKEKYTEQKQILEEKLSLMVSRLQEAHSALYNAQTKMQDLEYELANLEKGNVVNLMALTLTSWAFNYIWQL